MSHMIPKPTSRSLVRLLSLTTNPCGRSLCTPTAETRTQKLERIADELIDLNKLERYDFTILWRLKMGLNRYGPAVTGLGSSGPASAGPASGAAEAKAAEKTAFDIKLEKYDAAAKIKNLTAVTSKHEEICAPLVYDLDYMARICYSPLEIHAMMKAVLFMLGWCLKIPMPYVFLVRYIIDSVSSNQKMEN